MINLTECQTENAKGTKHSQSFLYQVNLTRDCNLRCTHCYIHSDIKAKSQKMTMDNLLKITLDIAEHLVKIKKNGEIHLIGGEPTMLGLAFFREAIPKMRLIFKQHDVVIEIGLVSNLLNPDIIAISKLCDRVTTSYEPKTRFVSALGVYKPKLELQWLLAVQSLQKNGIDVGITTAITRQTIQLGAKNILEWFYSKNIKKIHFGFFIPEGDGLENKEDVFPAFIETSNFLIEASKWYFAKRVVDPDVWVNPIESMVLALTTGEPVEDIMCPILAGSLDIDWNGNAATCLEAGGALEPEWAGNVLQESIIQVVENKVFKEMHLAVSKPQKSVCLSCEYYKICRSGCSVLTKHWDTSKDLDCPGFKSYIQFIEQEIEKGEAPKFGGIQSRFC